MSVCEVTRQGCDRASACNVCCCSHTFSECTQPPGAARSDPWSPCPSVLVASQPTVPAPFRLSSRARLTQATWSQTCKHVCAWTHTQTQAHVGSIAQPGGRRQGRGPAVPSLPAAPWGCLVGSGHVQRGPVTPTDRPGPQTSGGRGPVCALAASPSLLGSGARRPPGASYLCPLTHPAPR